MTDDIVAGANFGLTSGYAVGDTGWGAAQNKNLRMLDAGVFFSVEETVLNDPPASPALGDRHIIGAAPTGAWAGQANQLAYWTVDETSTQKWEFIEPENGMTVPVVGSVSGTTAYIGTYFYGTGIGWTLQAPSEAVSSAALDAAFGSTPGDILYRSSAGSWTVLPAGAEGQVLSTSISGTGTATVTTLEWLTPSGGGTGGGGGSPWAISDGTNTVSDVETLLVSGGTVSGGSDAATLTIAGGGGSGTFQPVPVYGGLLLSRPRASAFTANNNTNVTVLEPLGAVGPIIFSVDTFDSQSSGLSAALFNVAVPSSAEWTLTALIEAPVTQTLASQFTGIAITDTSGAFIFEGYGNQIPPQINIQKWPNVSNFGSGLSGEVVSGGSAVWLRVHYVSGNFLFYWSLNGIAFDLLNTVAASNLGSLAELGIIVDQRHGSENTGRTFSATVWHFQVYDGAGTPPIVLAS
jgi:hypothetical protein